MNIHLTLGVLVFWQGWQPTVGFFVHARHLRGFLRSELAPEQTLAVARLDKFEERPNGSSKTGTSAREGEDSVEQFASDLTVVLKRLRPDDKDPEVPALFQKTRLSVTFAWKVEDWVEHSARWRFIRYLRTLPTSRLLWRTAPQMIVFTVVAILAAVISPPRLLSQAIIPLTPLGLVSTFVAALLSVRSNTGMSRLGEGRVAWGNVVFNTREIAQLIGTKIFPKDPQLALLLARHVSLFGWALKAQLRGKQKNLEDVVRTMLSKADADFVLSQRKFPVAINAKLRQGFQHLAEKGQLTTAEEMSLDKAIRELDHAIMWTDRIVASPIPPIYTSHTTRLLMFYLLSLPWALRQSSLNAFVSFLVSLVVGYTMIGLDEISHLLEQPFRLMPLNQLSKLSMMDVGDSLVQRPVPLDQSLFLTKHQLSIAQPEYW